MAVNFNRIPVVFTKGIIVFPEQETTIEIARPSSVEAVMAAQRENDSYICMVSQVNPKLEEPTTNDVFNVGTICVIKSMVKRSDGLRLVIEGVHRYTINSFETVNGYNYALGIIRHNIIGGDVRAEEMLVKKMVSLIEEANTFMRPFPQAVVQRLKKGAPADYIIDSVAQHLSMPFDKKQLILQEQSLNERLLLAIKAFEEEKELVRLENEINFKVKKVIDEHQREYFLREKLKVIKDELGDVADKERDIAEIREKLDNNPYPKTVKNKVLDELKRYDSMSPNAPESAVIRNYIDWLISVPWYEKTEDSQNLKSVEKVLNEGHYGLEKVKERILEYLAVKQMTNSLKSPILCLVGPPGVGKTSLAHSIGEALGRKFIKASLGGVKDESEIRGHRRTYLGALPGRIVQSMKKAGVLNPVFLLDEIDKMASDHRGDPASAMLEVLDPEQNEFFSDHYLEEPYDLSNVLFVATANYIEGIPEALKDRLEIIQLSSYTETEKLHITKDHLIPKELESHGLDKKQLKIKDSDIMYLIRHYTKEAGVRQLNRIIAALCRKTVLKVLRDGETNVTINKKIIVEMLGKERFDYSRKEKKPQVGVVTGLAYTQFGGDILPIEVTHFDGKGKLVITGQLGDVMKESATIALDYVKSNSKKFNIDKSVFENHDIHIHVPEGAVPKDGPSAGITMTTALVSALTNRAVRSDIAMTGEITLRGNVLPIGGLKEKSISAYRSGIDTILIPKENEKDIDELPKEVKDKLEIISVDNIDKVLDLAIVK